MPTGEFTGGAASGPRRLEARGISVEFAGVRALDDVDLHLDHGEILGLIGPNGSGKTTTLNVLSGFLEPVTGTIHVGGADATGWPPRKLSRRGVGRTFQDVRMFSLMTVRKNVLAAALASGLSRRAASARTAEILERFELAEVAEMDAASLPYGKLRLAAIARTLATGPDFLLLDEPAAGLNERESDELLDELRRVRADTGCGLLVVEHDMRLIMRLCDRVQVLDSGRTIALGDPATVKSNPVVVEAYLGDTAVAI